MKRAIISREELRSALVVAASSFDFALAAWIGGSDATGRTDELSDIDLQFIAPDDQVERTIESVRDALERLSPIQATVRMPGRPATPYEQQFFQLRDTDPLHVIDLSVFPTSTPLESRYLEPERHGTPVVLFDRGGHLEVPPLNWASHLKKIEKRLTHLRDLFEVFQVLPQRSVARGHLAEAAAVYQRFTLAPLVELLRMRHDPARFDYGFRYLDRDLPPADRALVERWLFPRDGEELARFQREAWDRFNAELAALDAGEWRPDRPSKPQE